MKSVTCSHVGTERCKVRCVHSVMWRRSLRLLFSMLLTSVFEDINTSTHVYSCFYNVITPTWAAFFSLTFTAVVQTSPQLVQRQINLEAVGLQTRHTSLVVLLFFILWTECFPVVSKMELHIDISLEYCIVTTLFQLELHISASSLAAALGVSQRVPLGSNPTQPRTNTNSCSSLKILEGQTFSRNHWPHPAKWYHRLSFWVFALSAFCLIATNRQNLLTSAQTIQASLRASSSLHC